MELNYKVLKGALCLMDAKAALIDYIFKVQGADLRKLNYEEAGDEIGCSARTIYRYVGELADRKIIYIKDGKLKLNDKYITQI